MFDYKEKIIADLKHLGIQRGDVVLMHSSYKALSSGSERSFDELLNCFFQAFMEVIGDDGTLILPSLSYELCNPQNPFFNVRETPSNVGAIAEYFRQMPHVIRSLSPTHSCCAIGRLTEWMTSGHINDTTPCGPNSPYRRVFEQGGKILMLGCGLKPNTSMHAIEELVEPPYLFGDSFEYELIDDDGNRVTTICRAHRFYKTIQRYDRIEGLVRMTTGNVLSARCHVMDAKEMWLAAETRLKADPLYFVDIAE